MTEMTNVFLTQEKGQTKNVSKEAGTIIIIIIENQKKK